MKDKQIFNCSSNEILNPDNKFLDKIFTKDNSKFNKRNNKLLLLFEYLIIVLIFFIFIYYYLLIKKIKIKIKIIENNYKNLYAISEKENIRNNELIIENKLIKYKRESIEWPIPKSIKFKPWMTTKELKAFCSFMKPGNIYFEFGAGGSTNIASYYKLKTYSVESDVEWHKKLKNNNIKANYITIDLKAHSKGFPGKRTSLEDWKKYIQAYKSEYNADIILIDGRFRVACGLDIFPKIRNDTIVLIHDYTNRYKYHILENYYLKIKTWDRLAAFIKRPNIINIPQKVYNKYLEQIL